MVTVQTSWGHDQLRDFVVSVKSMRLYEDRLKQHLVNVNMNNFLHNRAIFQRNCVVIS